MRGTGRGLQDRKASLEDADNERVARGHCALQSEVEFEAAVSELGAAGIDRARVSFLAQEEIAAPCAGAVGCDIKQLPASRSA